MIGHVVMAVVVMVMMAVVVISCGNGCDGSCGNSWVVVCVMTVVEMHGGHPLSLQVFVTSSYNMSSIVHHPWWWLRVDVQFVVIAPW